MIEQYADDDERLDRLPAHVLELRERARRDFPFFAERFLKIKPKVDLQRAGEHSGPLIPFTLNEAQREVWATIALRWSQGRTPKPVVLKARQVGISTLVCGIVFWLMWRQMYTKAAIVAYRKDTTLKELNETFNTFYESLPENYRPRLRQNRRSGRIAKNEVYFDDRKADCMFVVQTPGAMRGVARDVVLCTEVSFYKEPDEFFGGFLPAMSSSPTSLIVRESSPADGYFRDIYESAKRENTDADAKFIPWWFMRQLYAKPLIHKGRYLYDARTERRIRFSAADRKEQEALSRMAARLDRPPITDEQMYWRQCEIDETYEGDEEFFNQEYPRDDVSAFERATRSVFKVALPLVRKTSEEMYDLYPDAAMYTVRSSTYGDPAAEQIIELIDEPRPGWIDQERRPGLMVIREPEPGQTYTIGADVADDADDSEDDNKHAFSVACVYCCNTREQVAEWRGHIDPHDWGDELVKLGYLYNTALLCVERNNMGVASEGRIRSLNYPMRFRWPDMNVGAHKLTNKEMWETNSRTKMLMIGALRQWMRDGLFIVRSPGLADELAHYVIKGNRFVSDDRESDRIIAAALAVQAVEQTEFRYKSIVLGANGSIPDRAAAGAAQRILRSRNHMRFSAPPELPEEMEELQDLRVSDIYEGVLL